MSRFARQVARFCGGALVASLGLGCGPAVEPEDDSAGSGMSSTGWDDAGGTGHRESSEAPDTADTAETSETPQTVCDRALDVLEFDCGFEQPEPEDGDRAPCEGVRRAGSQCIVDHSAAACAFFDDPGSGAAEAFSDCMMDI